MMTCSVAVFVFARNVAVKRRKEPKKKKVCFIYWNLKSATIIPEAHIKFL